MTPSASMASMVAGTPRTELPLTTSDEGADFRVCYPWRWSEKELVIRLAFLCQIFVVALNISLTPLANVLAHGKFNLGQEIVLAKLFGDFVGRVLFFGLPNPRRLKRHLALNWVVACLRLPAWIVLIMHALSKEPWFNEAELLAIWLPFVLTAAFGGSWLQVVAIQAADAQEKRAVAARMNIAVYLGFLCGVIFAGVFAMARCEMTLEGRELRAYQPGKVSFQSDNFERPQLLALCEKLVHSGQEALTKGPKRGKENLAAAAAESPRQAPQTRQGTRCGSRPPGFKEDRASTAATGSTKAGESRLSLGCCSPPWTGESQRLPSLPLTAR
ncbi:unnamed protein product [Effrenium voratum]|nr:unnamed protein product [Effrenium voratum]